MLDFNKIKNDLVDRVIEIAKEGQLEILFIGNTEAELSAKKAEELGCVADWLKTCPCGNNEDEERECHCSIDEVVEYRQKIKSHPADIKLKVRRIKWKYIRPQVEKHLDSDGVILFTNASDQFMFDFRQIDSTLRIARAIADLGGYEKIKASHLAEALQYKVK
jgi:predicted ATPase with chaperone activity